jgi:hypothetical protein
VADPVVTGSPRLIPLRGSSGPVSTGHSRDLDEPLGDCLPGCATGRYRTLSALQFARRNPNLCLWVASTIGGRAGRLCAKAMAVRAGVWGWAPTGATIGGSK